MSSTLAYSVLNIIATFSPEDKAVFDSEYKKLQKPEVAKMKPKKIKPRSNIPTLEQCVMAIRAKYSISEQGKLA